MPAYLTTDQLTFTVEFADADTEAVTRVVRGWIKDAAVREFPAIGLRTGDQAATVLINFGRLTEAVIASQPDKVNQPVLTVRGEVGGKPTMIISSP